MPHLGWNEVRDRAIRFSREHAGDRSESAEKQTFWNDFFNVFGLRRASLASFEANVVNLKGNKGAIDLLWRGKLLVEHKSFGEDLSLAETQAFTYIEDLTREQRWEEIPRFVLVSDFAHFVLYDLEPEEQRDLPLVDGRKVAPHHFTLADFPKHIQTPSLPDARPRSDRFRCGGRKSKFLAVTREALIAELLGDLQVASGKLDQAVVAAARMADRIDASTRSLNVATGEYRTAVDDMAARFRLEIATLMQTATAHAAKAVLSQQTAVLQQAGAGAVQKAIHDGLGNRLKMYFAVAVIASGLLSAGMVMTAIKLRWVI